RKQSTIASSVDALAARGYHLAPGTEHGLDEAKEPTRWAAAIYYPPFYSPCIRGQDFQTGDLPRRQPIPAPAGQSQEPSPDRIGDSHDCSYMARQRHTCEG